jgi:hypothetical protein
MVHLQAVADTDADVDDADDADPSEVSILTILRLANLLRPLIMTRIEPDGLGRR